MIWLKLCGVFGAAIYVLGFVAVFALHTQMPATLDLAIVRSLCWPASIVARHFVPRGTPLPMD